MLGEHTGFEPRHHLVGLIAVDAAVEHDDVVAGEALLELNGKPARIARRGGAGAGACGRRRPDSDDRKRLAARETLRRVLERMIESREFGRRGASDRRHREQCGCLR